MLRFYVLNAGKGDSIVIEHQHDGQRHFGVVDSNCATNQQPPALRKLIALGADRLSFLALTHPHADHYSGLTQIIEHFENRIDSVISFPIERDRKRLQRLAAKYGKLVTNNELPNSRREQAFDLLKFLATIRDHPDWHAPSGYDSLLAFNGFDEVQVRHVLPPSRVKGKFFQGLDLGTLELEDPSANELSLAISFEYRGVRVLLGADGMGPIWAEQARFARRGRVSFGADAVKIPHHGSAIDCSDPTLDVVFREGERERIALISANGSKHHPDPKVLASLAARGIKPYCTNLAEICGSTARVRQLAPLAGLEPGLNRFIESVKESNLAPRACQGDITYAISDTGAVSIDRELNNACAFRGDYQLVGIQ